MTRRYENIMLGADPELFLQNPNDGGFISAHKYVKGSKRHPFPVTHGAVQLDGTAAEFNIDPVTNVNDWVRNIGAVMGSLKEMTIGSGYVLAAEPVADFEPSYFDAHVPSSAKKLGCDPDFDAWELCPNETPDGTRTFRTGAGHVHIGWGSKFDVYSPTHFEECARVARQLDYHLGINSLLWDASNRRRELYGKAGAFRPKSYGVEYRVLSNAWLRSELLQRWVFTAAQAALKDMDDGVIYEEFHGDYARRVINENNTNWLYEEGAPAFDNMPLPPGVTKNKAA